MPLGLSGGRKPRGPGAPTEDDDAWEQAEWLLENADNLSSWEEGFLNDLVDQEWKRPTDRQQEVLNRIRDEKC